MTTIYEIGTGNPLLRRRTEKGWTLDFVFNREDNPWISGSTFYYWGIQDETDERYYADNNLSFSFTEDGRIKWESYRYTGLCDTTSGYTESFYTSTGQTEVLCMGGTSNDFNITITFERYKYYENCDIENEGGWNDLIIGPHSIPYSPIKTGSTANQITTGYTVTNNINDWVSGATITNEYVEELSKKWWKERDKRLGVLKIYLNGNPIYKLKDWMEIIPSRRGSENPIVQIWGGGTTGSNDLHLGETNFTIKNIKYFEEPLSFLGVQNNYKTEIIPNYDIVECNYAPCDELVVYDDRSLLFADGSNFLTNDNNIILY